MSQVQLNKEDLLSLSGIQHFAFCKRQWALIHIEGQWAENLHTIEGNIFHERVHTPGYYAVSGIRSEKGVWLKSEKLRIIGIADIVEVVEDENNCIKTLYPIEYKKGKRKVNNCDRLQLAAQALCLEEMFNCKVEEGAVFYGQTKRREKVLITEELRSEVLAMLKEMNELYSLSATPKPEYKTQCKGCSLKEICFPKAAKMDVSDYWDRYR